MKVSGVDKAKSLVQALDFSETDRSGPFLIGNVKYQGGIRCFFKTHSKVLFS